MRSSALSLCATSLALGAAGPVAAQTLPVADAGVDQVVECTDAEGTPVELDGSGSSDADRHALSFTWTSPSFPPDPPVTGESPTVVLPLGTHLITLTVDDGVDGSDTDEVRVTVEDSTPPELEVDGRPVSLWPPNHKYHHIDIGRFVATARDACERDLGPHRVIVFEATSDEPENTRGDGNTDDDIVIVDACRALALRSERIGGSDGRVYEVTLALQDGSGHTTHRKLDVATVRKAPPFAPIDSGDEFVVENDGHCDGGFCPELPAPTCVAPQGASSLFLLDHPRRDALRFRMSRIDSSVGDFGDPTRDTDYELCVWTREPGGDVERVMDPRAPAGPAWHARRDGFLFAPPPRHWSPLRRIRLRAVEGGRGSIDVAGSGPGLAPPDLPLDPGVEVEVQLRNSEGACWGVTFDEPRVNTDTVYRAVSD